MSNPNWLLPEEQVAWSRISPDLTTSCRRCSAGNCSDVGVVDSGLRQCSLSLSETPEGRMRPFELGQELAWEKSRLSHHMTRMIERDWSNARNARPTNAERSLRSRQRGRKAISAAAPGHVASVRRYFIDATDPGGDRHTCQDRRKVRRLRKDFTVRRRDDDKDGDTNHEIRITGHEETGGGECQQ